jgi:WD40-like Beta Propeller Repeat
VEDPSRNGIYWVRSSDGSGLKQITSNTDGEDTPGDFSPDGDRLVFVRLGKNGQAGIFVTKVDGSGLHRISPPGMMVDDIFGGSWSPDGSRILFMARETQDHHKAIWVVNADGTAPNQLPIVPACGGPFSDPDSAGFAKLVARRDEDRLHQVEPGWDDREHLRRERRWDRPPPGDERR